MTSEVYNRIDGLTNLSLLKELLSKFQEIIEDQRQAGDDFDVSDVIDYLSRQMQEHAQDVGLYEGKEENGDLKEHFSRFLKDYQ